MALDLNAVHQLRSLDSDSGGGLVKEMLEMFDQSTPERMQRMRTAIAARDAATIEREAHSLKGSCGALGALDMLDLCGELERRARVGDLGDAPRHLDALEALFPAVRAELLEAYGLE